MLLNQMSRALCEIHSTQERIYIIYIYIYIYYIYIYIYLTIILRGRAGYRMVDNQRGA